MKVKEKSRRFGSGALSRFAFGVAIGAALVPPSHAAEAVRYDIPPGPLDEVLKRFAQQSGLSIAMDPASLTAIASPGVRGDVDDQTALARILAGSGYRAQKTDAGYSIAPESAGATPKTMPLVKVQADRPYDTQPER